MTIQKSLLLGAGALMLAIGLGATSTLSAQNTNPTPPAFHGRGMGPGGPGMGGPGGPLAMFMGRAAQQLGLTDAQQSQIKSIAEASKSSMQGLMKQVGEARRALLVAQVNGTDVTAPSGQVAQAELSLAVAEANVIAQVMQILTPDQQAQVKQFAQNPPRPGARGQK